MIPNCLRAIQDILRLYAIKLMPLQQFLHCHESGNLDLTDFRILTKTSAICRWETDQVPLAAEHVSRSIQRSPTTLGLFAELRPIAQLSDRLAAPLLNSFSLGSSSCGQAPDSTLHTYEASH